MTSVASSSAVGDEFGPDLMSQPQVIDWHMMEKRKFYPLVLSCSMTVRTMVYPLTVVKTRIQIQRQHSVYRGMFHAATHIAQTEGMRGLYRGYWASVVHAGIGTFYVTIYEWTRHMLLEKNLVFDNSLRALVAGSVASVICQTISVPADVVSQHMMIVGNVTPQTTGPRVADPLHLLPRIQAAQHANTWRYYSLAPLVATRLWRTDGLVGFYRGYLSSILLFVPNSAIFWFTYHRLCALYSKWTPNRSTDLMVQAAAGPSAGATSALLTNCLDLYRARIQVQRASYWDTARILWREERFEVFVKGLWPRLTTSVIYSFLIAVSYESVKRLSIHKQYENDVRW